MISSATACFHCGEPLPADRPIEAAVAGATRSFCCHGCEAAALLIDGAGLGEYYRWRTETAPRPAVDGTDLWSGFDRPEFTARLVAADGSSQVNLQIEGMRCSACGWLLEQCLQRIDGVQGVSLNPATARAHVQYRDVPLSTLLRSIASLGYQPHVLGVGDTIEVATRERRAALKRVAVAGFGMMQVMMIAVALYESARVGMSPVIRDYLRVISLLMTTPVMLYAGAPFYLGAWRALKARQLGMDVPVSLGILLAFAASALNTLRGSGEIYFDSVVMFLFLLLVGRYLEMLARHRTNSSTEALARLVPAMTRRLTASGEERVPVAALVPGDRIRVEVGEAIAADGVIDGPDTLVDEALMTGESTPLAKHPGATVIAGAINVLRPVVIRVSAVGQSTVLAGMARLLERASTERPERTLLADRIARRFVACVLLGSLLTAVFWWWFDPSKAFGATLAVLVATCPCALSLATPVAVTAAMGGLARRGVLVSRADALEALASVDYALLDKTGTLTLGKARIADARALGPLNLQDCRAIAATLENASGHPLAAAFEGEPPRAVSEVRVVVGAGVEGRIDGLRYRIGHSVFVAELAGPAPAGLESDGVHLGREGGWLARYELEDTLRPGIRGSLRRLRDAGLDLEVASGDHANAVGRTAAAVGIGRWGARLAPAQKLERVRELRAQGHRIAVVGDGANDAAGLGAADVSVALGGGSALARADADLIIVGGDLGAIADAIAHARRARAVIRQNLIWAAAYNLTSLPLAALGYMPPWVAAVGMSVSSLLVVGNALRLMRVARRAAPAAGSLASVAGAAA